MSQNKAEEKKVTQEVSSGLSDTVVVEDVQKNEPPTGGFQNSEAENPQVDTVVATPPEVPTETSSESEKPVIATLEPEDSSEKVSSAEPNTSTSPKPLNEASNTTPKSAPQPEMAKETVVSSVVQKKEDETPKSTPKPKVAEETVASPIVQKKEDETPKSTPKPKVAEETVASPIVQKKEDETPKSAPRPEMAKETVVSPVVEETATSSAVPKKEGKAPESTPKPKVVEETVASSGAPKKEDETQKSAEKTQLDEIRTAFENTTAKYKKVVYEKLDLEFLQNSLSSEALRRYPLLQIDVKNLIHNLSKWLDSYLKVPYSDPREQDFVDMTTKIKRELDSERLVVVDVWNHSISFWTNRVKAAIQEKTNSELKEAKTRLVILRNKCEKDVYELIHLKELESLTKNKFLFRTQKGRHIKNQISNFITGAKNEFNLYTHAINPEGINQIEEAKRREENFSKEDLFKVFSNHFLPTAIRLIELANNEIVKTEALLATKAYIPDASVETDEFTDYVTRLTERFPVSSISNPSHLEKFKMFNEIQQSQQLMHLSYPELKGCFRRLKKLFDFCLDEIYRKGIIPRTTYFTLNLDSNQDFRRISPQTFKRVTDLYTLKLKLTSTLPMITDEGNTKIDEQEEKIRELERRQQELERNQMNIFKILRLYFWVIWNKIFNPGVFEIKDQPKLLYYEERFSAPNTSSLNSDTRTSMKITVHQDKSREYSM